MEMLKCNAASSMVVVRGSWPLLLSGWCVKSLGGLRSSPVQGSTCSAALGGAGSWGEVVSDSWVCVSSLLSCVVMLS